jgi:hypothetical protein
MRLDGEYRVGVARREVAALARPVHQELRQVHHRLGQERASSKDRLARARLRAIVEAGLGPV